VSVAGFGGGWREWLARDPAARRVADVLTVADAIGIAVTVTLIAATAILGHAVGGLTLLLVPGIPLLVAGQLWGILVAVARRPPGSGRRSRARAAAALSIGDSLRAMFGPVDRRVTWAVTALSVIGLLSFLTGIIFTGDGSPAGSSRGCPYREMNHGVYSCVSRSAYDLAGAAEQRMAAGIFLVFFAMHFYAALASRAQAGGQPAV
jgi:hypothetical protein